MHVYEVRPRRDKCGIHLISDALPFESRLKSRQNRFGLPDDDDLALML